MSRVTRRQAMHMAAMGAVGTAVGLFGCKEEGQAPAAPSGSVTGGTAQDVPQPVFLITAHNQMEPVAVAEKLRALREKGALTFEQQIDLGSAYFLQLKWVEAQEAFHSAVGSASDEVGRATAFLAAAQAAAAAKRFNDAGLLANQAQRQIDEKHQLNRQIAAARYAFWTAAGNEAERGAAEQMIARLDIKTQGQEVCSAETIVVIAAVAAVITFVAYQEGILTTDDARQILLALLAALLAAPLRG